MTSLRVRSLLLAAAAALAACADAGAPREEGAFWWPATGPDEAPPPVISALTPSGAYAGEPAFVLTVTGARFVQGAEVTWNLSPRPTTFVSPTTVRAQIAAADVATAGLAGVAVVNPGGAASGTLTFSISPDVLSIASLTPPSVVAGDPAFVLTVSGRRFVAGSVVTWNGAPRPTTYLSSTALRAAIDAADVATGGWVNVRVENPGGEGSSFVTFSVMNPAPLLTSLSPTSAPLGGGDFVLTVNGARFVDGSSVSWNGFWRPTTFVSSSELRATIAAADLATAGTASVAVHTPAPGGGSSAPLTIPITRPSPTVTAMSPASIAPGSSRFTLTVTGSGFVPDTVLRWNGSPRPTTVASSSVLRATIDPADVATAGTAAVSVYTAPPDGGAASAGTFTVAAPAPRLPQAVAYQIDPAHSGYVDFGTALALPVDPAWVVTLSDVASYPLIAGGRVFLLSRGSSNGGYGTRLHALHLATGAAAWGPLEVPGTYFWAAHAYEGGRLFVVNADGVVRSFDAATGAPGWTVQLSGWMSAPPTASGGLVYVGGGGRVSARDAADGRERWSTFVSNGDTSSPAVGVDGVYVSYPCQVYKLDLLAGSYVWNASSGCSGGGGKTAALAHGALWVRDFSTYSRPVGTIYDAFDASYVGSFGPSGTMIPIPAFGPSAAFNVSGGALQARDLSGDVLWTFPGDGTFSSAPIVVGSTVFAGTATGKVYAVDAAAGTQRWIGLAGAAIPPPDEHNVSQPLTGLGAGEGYLVVPAGRRIVAWKLVP